MFNNFRKSVIYKICGYSIYLWLIVTIFVLTLLMFSATSWNFFRVMGLLILLVNSISVILLIYTILFIIAFFTRHKFATEKFSKVADVGCIIILILYPLVILGLFQVTFSNLDMKKRKIEYQDYLQNEYITDLKNRCTMLNNSVPTIINKLGPDFTKDEFATEFAKLNSIDNISIGGVSEILYIDKNNRRATLSIVQNNLSHFGKEPCNLEQKNCYVYLWTHKNYGECQFYFNDNKKVVPTNKTIELLNK